jgi:hypothetical protein
VRLLRIGGLYEAVREPRLNELSDQRVEGKATICNAIPLVLVEAGEEKAIGDVDAELIAAPSSRCMSSKPWEQPGSASITPRCPRGTGSERAAGHPDVEKLIIVPNRVSTSGNPWHRLIRPVGKAVQVTINESTQ